MVWERKKERKKNPMNSTMAAFNHGKGNLCVAGEYYNL
jgi:hypothetical protein